MTPIQPRSTRNKLPLFILLPLLPLLPLLVACESSPKFWVRDSQEFLVPTKGIQSIEVRTHNGYIRCEGFEQLQTAKVVAKIRAGGQTEADARACLAAIRLTVENKGGVLHTGYDFSRKQGWQAQVSFEIDQPANASLDAETHNGSVNIIRLRASIDAQTHNGSVSAKDCEGKWVLNTHNGAILASGKSSDLNLETHNGSVKIRLSQTGPIAGNVLTHNGSVIVAVAKDSSFRVRCQTTNGQIQNTLPLTEIQVEKTSLRGKLGLGQTDLRLDTHNGNITLSSSENQ